MPSVFNKYQTLNITRMSVESSQQANSKAIGQRLSPNKYGLISGSPDLKKERRVFSFNDKTNPMEFDRIEQLRASKERRITLK